MSAQTEIKVVQNDKLYNLNFTLEDSNGSAVDLTGATLKINTQRPGSSTIKFTGSMSIVNAAAGTCVYTVQAGDFDETGRYYAEIQVTFGSGQVLTYPNIVISVQPELPRE